MINVSVPPKKLPALRDIAPVFAMLFGNDASCKLRKDAIPSHECVVFATYRDGTGAIQRMLACDLAFANSAGAALSAIPPASVKCATNAGKFAENVIDNLSEVMNIAVNLLIDSFGSRLELVAVLPIKDVEPKTLSAFASGQRMKLDISIPRYDLGRLDIISA